MHTITIEPFSLIGISVRTTNENGQSLKDITELWDRFLTMQIIDQIPNKIDSTIYCVYTDYEKDHTKPYTALLGCKVKSLETVPEGFIGKLVKGELYTTFIAKGKLSDRIVEQEWIKIWNSNLNRAYTSDFEIYNGKAQNPDNAEVLIMIAVKS